MAEGADRYFKYQSNYLDVRNDALYPFGYGLSYTTFQYGDVRLSSSEMTRNGSVSATVTVTNIGSRDADEIVQLYVRDVRASISRPVKELKGFQRIYLKAGESREVTFPITRKELSFYDAQGREIIEPGEFHIMTGPDSRNVSMAVLNLK